MAGDNIGGGQDGVAGCGAAPCQAVPGARACGNTGAGIEPSAGYWQLSHARVHVSAVSVLNVVPVIQAEVEPGARAAVDGARTRARTLTKSGETG